VVAPSPNAEAIAVRLLMVSVARAACLRRHHTQDRPHKSRKTLKSVHSIASVPDRFLR
jgi:hypothetical protein